MKRAQINNIFDNVILPELDDETIIKDIVKDYEKLSKKCDEVISKIKARKNKK